MNRIRATLVAALILAGLPPTSAETYSNADTSLTLLYQNNLNESDASNHIGAILLSPMSYQASLTACSALSETLLTQAAIQAHLADFTNSLAYLAFENAVSGRPSKRAWPFTSWTPTAWTWGGSMSSWRGGPLAQSANAYYIGNDTVAIYVSQPQGIRFAPAGFFNRQTLPVLCTQSAQGNNPYNTVAAPSNEVTVPAAGNSYIGFRNKLSFRFLGIRYSAKPEDFTYSTLYNQTGLTVNATAYGPECLQYGSGSKDCFFLNIQTPYIPKQGSTDNLRPVLFWIHGGGFTGGTGADPGTDGGNLASREDIVVVTINYRLSTYGFLAVPGTDVKGNFGIGDQINALQWTIENIASFGGDPSQITIMGESAGAGSVRVLLGSPPAIGKFQGAIAMSNLGGGKDLGESGNYGTTYSSYYTISQSYAVAGQQIFTAAGCTQTTVAAQVACLQAYPGDLTSFGTVARYVVQDGTIVDTEELLLTSKNSNTADINVIFGNTENDGASFSAYSKTCTSEVTCLAANLYCSQAEAQSIIDSGLFPLYDTGNITADSFNVSQRVVTDNTFRCVDQATAYAGSESGAFKSAYYYQMDRTVSGYNPNNVVDGSTNDVAFYYRLHGSDLPWAFGNLYTLRSPNDLYSIQLTTAYFAEFVRTGQPNPANSYLTARNYTHTLAAVRSSGPWNAVSSTTGPIKVMDYPSYTSDFIDLPQCAWLNYSISYYANGGI